MVKSDEEWISKKVNLKQRNRKGERLKAKKGVDRDDSVSQEGHVVKEDTSSDEDDFSDILSSDSDNSSLDELREELEAQQKAEAKRGETKDDMRTERDKELERMFFYSIYVDQLPIKTQPKVKPQMNEEDNDTPYGEVIKLTKDTEAARFVIDEFDEEAFESFLKTEINEDEGMEDIDGNVSIKTLLERNFRKLRMDGPSRRVALIFSYKPGSKPISENFKQFMHIQKDQFPFISGVLLYYKDIGIHVVEGSEYILLMHLPIFFKADFFKKLIKCKVLAVEQLSPMKYFEQYSCYKGKPPKCNIKIPDKLETYEDSIKYMKIIGRGLDVFFKYAYSDFPSVTDDNELPESVQKELPPKELLEFALAEKQWMPGLREVRQWYANLTSVPGEIDPGEFVWPPRSDCMPLHILHPAPDEEETIKEAMVKKLKDKKLVPLGTAKAGEDKKGEVPKQVPVAAPRSDDDEFEGVKKITSVSSLFDLEKLDDQLEDILEVVEQSDDD